MCLLHSVAQSQSHAHFARKVRTQTRRIWTHMINCIVGRRTRKPPFETASTRQFSYLRPWRKYRLGKERVVSGRCPKNNADFDGLVFWVLTSQELGDSVLIALNHHLPKVSASGGDGRMCQPSGPVTCMDIHVCANVCGHAHSHVYGNVCRHVCRQMCSHGGWLEFQPCFGPDVV